MRNESAMHQSSPLRCERSIASSIAARPWAISPARPKPSAKSPRNAAVCGRPSPVTLSSASATRRWCNPVATSSRLISSTPLKQRPQICQKANACLSECPISMPMKCTACRVALLNGDLTAAEHFIGMLIGHSERHALAFWQIWGRCFKGVLLIKRDEVATGLHHLRVALAELRVTGLGLPHTAAFLGDLAEGLGRARGIAQGLAAIDEAIERSQRNGELWCIADSLRIKGELLLLENSANAQERAEDYFLQCLDWARKQQVLSWELRGATSLARLRKLQDRAGEARELLAAVYGRFTEGFETVDLKIAKALLDSMP